MLHQDQKTTWSKQFCKNQIGVDLVMFQYDISFHGVKHTTKPTGKEIGIISNHLVETKLETDSEYAHGNGLSAHRLSSLPL